MPVSIRNSRHGPARQSSFGRSRVFIRALFSRKHYKDIMELSTTSETNQKAHRSTRRMGMGLSVIGSVITAAGLVVFYRAADRHIGCLQPLILGIGVLMLTTGCFVWYSADRKMR